MASTADRWAAAWNAHDAGGVERWYAPDGHHRMASGNTYAGRAAIRAMVDRTLAAYPDLSFVVRSSFSAEDRFAIEYTMRGTQVSAVGDRPGTGRTVVVDGALLGVLDRSGRVAAAVDYLDHHAVRQQLGLAGDGDAVSEGSTEA